MAAILKYVLPVASTKAELPQALWNNELSPKRISPVADMKHVSTHDKRLAMHPWKRIARLASLHPHLHDYPKHPSAKAMVEI